MTSFGLSFEQRKESMQRVMGPFDLLIMLDEENSVQLAKFTLRLYPSIQQENR